MTRIRYTIYISYIYTNTPITLSLNKKQESSFSIISPKLCNSLPHSIRSIVSDHTFKVKLKTHLFNIAYNNYYTIHRRKLITGVDRNV